VQDSGIDGGHHHRHAETNAPARTPRHPDDAHAAQFDALLPTPFGDRGMMHSTAGGMAVAVLPLVLRGQAQPPGMYYSCTYHLMNPRQRRWHIEVREVPASDMVLPLRVRGAVLALVLISEAGHDDDARHATCSVYSEGLRVRYEYDAAVTYKRRVT